MKALFVLIIYSLMTVTANTQDQNLYDFTAKTIDGQPFDFSTLQGKKVLIVNTASKCGLTPQYESLQELYELYGGEDFIILGFPANNFLWQEPGSNEEIQTFCTKNYGVSFLMMEKISVKGKNIHPLYDWLTKKENNGLFNAPVKWNFQKFMIDEQGRLVDYASPRTNPMDKKITEWITGT